LSHSTSPSPTSLDKIQIMTQESWMGLRFCVSNRLLAANHSYSFPQDQRYMISWEVWGRAFIHSFIYLFNVFV
jgi:hypothetical protein